MRLISYTGTLTIANAITDGEMARVVNIANERMDALFSEYAVIETGTGIKVVGTKFHDDSVHLSKVFSGEGPLSQATRPLAELSVKGELAADFTADDCLVTHEGTYESVGSMKFNTEDFLDSRFGIKIVINGESKLDESDVRVGDYERVFNVGIQVSDILGVAVPHRTLEEAVAAEEAANAEAAKQLLVNMGMATAVSEE